VLITTGMCPSLNNSATLSSTTTRLSAYRTLGRRRRRGIYSPELDRSSWNSYGSTSYSVPSSTRRITTSRRARTEQSGSAGIKSQIVWNMPPPSKNQERERPGNAPTATLPQSPGLPGAPDQGLFT